MAMNVWLVKFQTKRYSEYDMKNPGWRVWLVAVAFLFVVAFTGLFAVRTVRRAAYWRHHQDEQIRPWMSVGYIAHSHRVPTPVLREALGLPPKSNGPDRRPIREIAREQNRSVDEVIAILEDAIAKARSPETQPAILNRETPRQSPSGQTQGPPQ